MPKQKNPIITSLIQARVSAGYSELDLAKRMKTTVAKVLRIESIKEDGDALITDLQRYAGALGKHILFSFATETVG